MSGPDSTPPHSAPLKPIFLSYAREDSVAALRIADALRSGGMEVWFDQSELRGGDAWDQKIRQQIKECGLFMPVISDRTQLRGEGYFRLEWKLATERTHLMAEGMPFLAPVVVDATPEGGAIVPSEFMRVHWSRLPGALPTPEFVAQARRMLENQARRPAAATAAPVSAPAPRRGRWAAAAVAVAVLAAAGVGYLAMHRPAAVVVIPAAPASEVDTTFDPKSIAVLPFANMSEDKGNVYFADGVQEDVLTNLSFIHDLHLVSRTSVMQYRDTTKPLRQIGQELHVAYLLEGSVRREGNKVRVTGQLINARTDQQVWAQSYDRDLTDIFAIQGELAQSIATALQAVLSPEAKRLIDRRPTESIAAYDAYMKARSARNEVFVNSKAAQVLLRAAVALDPGFAEAWGALASSLAYDKFNNVGSENTMSEAKAALDRAVQLAPDDPTVIENSGDFYYYGYRDYARATELYLRLQILRPNDPEMYYSLGLIQRRQGRFVDSIANMRKALAMDPANFEMRKNYIDLLAAVRRYDEVRQQMAAYERDRPNNLTVTYMAELYAFNQNGSKSAFERLKTLPLPADQEPTRIYMLQGAYYLVGDFGEALRLYKQQRNFEENSSDPDWSQDVSIAETFAEAGDMGEARIRATQALAAMEQKKARDADNALLWSNLAMVYGLLGRREECLNAVAKTEALLPESKDAVLGPNYAYACCYALAWVGEKDRALAEAARLLQVPYGANVWALRAAPGGLRGDPRLQALVDDPKNNAVIY